jgi:hemolysin III
MDGEFPSYTPAERRADAVVHAVGLALGLAACAGLAAAALPRPDIGPRLLAGLGLYAFGLLAMLACSALYNLAAAVPPAGVALFAAGGALYSLGTVFHLWRGLPFQNAVWHGFVLGAAACRYAAVLREVAAA